MVLMMILPSIALAAEVTHQLGPYTVSFDMNTNMKYNVLVQEPIKNPAATIYGMRITTDNKTQAGVTIADYNNLTDTTTSTNLQMAGLAMVSNGFNPTVKEMVIDGKPGFVVTGVSADGAPKFTLFQAGYSLDSVNCECGPVSVGKNSVSILSSYPQDVTQGILSSIHVEKGKAAPQ
jgi:hypothetical protein